MKQNNRDWMDVEVEAWLYKRAHEDLWKKHWAKSPFQLFMEKIYFIIGLVVFGFVYAAICGLAQGLG